MHLQIVLRLSYRGGHRDNKQVVSKQQLWRYANMRPVGVICQRSCLHATLDECDVTNMLLMLALYILSP
jgi:hypothetical protein